MGFKKALPRPLREQLTYPADYILAADIHRLKDGGADLNVTSAT
jgi:hypothetical protein